MMLSHSRLQEVVRTMQDQVHGHSHATDDRNGDQKPVDYWNARELMRMLLRVYIPPITPCIFDSGHHILPA